MLYFRATFAERMRHANSVCVGATSNIAAKFIISLDFGDRGAIVVNETASRFKIKCEEILMNLKTLLVIVGLSLSLGLNACSKEAAAPDATKVETTTTTSPAATTEAKPADGAKSETKTTETKTTETKPADGAMKSPDAMKSPETTKSTTTKTTETKPADTKKP